MELFDDPAFVIGSDNGSAYTRYYPSSDPVDLMGSQHGIRLYRGDIELNSCLLHSLAGTRIHATSALLDGKTLLVCCGYSLFSLELPTLDLNWQIQVDLAACFQVHKIHDGYLTHGEVEISKTNKQGELEWSFSGADIFVTPDGSRSFSISDEHIELIDWNYHKYIIDFNGEVVT